jgi:hypothetical protein
MNEHKINSLGWIGISTWVIGQKRWQVQLGHQCSKTKTE